MIVDRLSGMAAGKLGMSDSAIAAQILYGVYKSDIRKMLLQSEWGRHLIDIGMGKDIDICSKVDIAPIVPKFRDEMIFVDGQ